MHACTSRLSPVTHSVSTSTQQPHDASKPGECLEARMLYSSGADTRQPCHMGSKLAPIEPLLDVLEGAPHELHDFSPQWLGHL